MTRRSRIKRREHGDQAGGEGEGSSEAEVSHGISTYDRPPELFTFTAARSPAHSSPRGCRRRDCPDHEQAGAFPSPGLGLTAIDHLRAPGCGGYTDTPPIGRSAAQANALSVPTLFPVDGIRPKRVPAGENTEDAAASLSGCCGVKMLTWYSWWPSRFWERPGLVSRVVPETRAESRREAAHPARTRARLC